jgi:hypothetical protein
MADSIEAKINAAISRAAQQIVDAVRADIAARVRDSLGVSGGRGAAGRAAGAGPRRRRRRGGAADGALVEKVVGYIKANPGQRTEEISKGIGADAKPALARLRAEGKVKTKGERRATTYALA